MKVYCIYRFGKLLNFSTTMNGANCMKFLKPYLYDGPKIQEEEMDVEKFLEFARWADRKVFDRELFKSRILACYNKEQLGNLLKSYLLEEERGKLEDLLESEEIVRKSFAKMAIWRDIEGMVLWKGLSEEQKNDFCSKNDFEDFFFKENGKIKTSVIDMNSSWFECPLEDYNIPNEIRDSETEITPTIKKEKKLEKRETRQMKILYAYNEASELVFISTTKHGLDILYHHNPDWFYDITIKEEDLTLDNFLLFYRLADSEVFCTDFFNRCVLECCTYEQQEKILKRFPEYGKSRLDLEDLVKRHREYDFFAELSEEKKEEFLGYYSFDFFFDNTNNKIKDCVINVKDGFTFDLEDYTEENKKRNKTMNKEKLKEAEKAGELKKAIKEKKTEKKNVYLSSVYKILVENGKTLYICSSKDEAQRIAKSLKERVVIREVGLTPEIFEKFTRHDAFPIGVIYVEHDSPINIEEFGNNLANFVTEEEVKYLWDNDIDVDNLEYLDDLDDLMDAFDLLDDERKQEFLNKYGDDMWNDDIEPYMGFTIVPNGSLASKDVEFLEISQLKNASTFAGLAENVNNVMSCEACISSWPTTLKRCSALITEAVYDYALYNNADEDRNLNLKYIFESKIATVIMELLHKSYNTNSEALDLDSYFRHEDREYRSRCKPNWGECKDE